MNRLLVRCLPALVLVAWSASAPRAEAAVYGYSTLTISAYYVISTGLTDIDYPEEMFYSVETDSYLFAGNSIASSGSSQGDIQLSTATSPNVSYWVQNNHWVNPVYGSDILGLYYVAGGWYVGSMSVTGSGESSSWWGPLCVGSTSASGDTYGSAPNITGVDYSSYGNEERGTTGYVILYGTHFLTTYWGTNVSSSFGTVAYLGPNQMNLYYSIPTSASSGTYSNNIGISTPYGSAAANFYVYDPPPSIDHISLTNVWSAGSNNSITIYGNGFGGNPSVSFSDPYISFTRNTWDDMSISGYLRVGADDPGGGVTVTVHASSYGGSYFQGPPGGAGGTATTGATTTPRPTATISQGGANISGTTQTVVVGQLVGLTGAELNVPSGVTVTARSWTVQGNTVSSYTVSNGSGAYTAFSDPGTTSASFYWISSGSNTVTYSGTLTDSANNHTTISATATFSVTKPNLNSYVSTTSGVSCCGSGLGFNIAWNAEVSTGSNEAGTVGYLQLVKPNHTRTANESSTTTLSSSTMVLDNPPGGVLFPTTAWGAGLHGYYGYSDGPSSPTSSSLLRLAIADSFNTYVMYKPSGSGSIWVTLGVLSWSYSASASKDGSGVWTLDSGSSFPSNPNGNGSSTLPTWANFVTNLSYQ